MSKLKWLGHAPSESLAMQQACTMNFMATVAWEHGMVEKIKLEQPMQLYQKTDPDMYSCLGHTVKLCYDGLLGTAKKSIIARVHSF